MAAPISVASVFRLAALASACALALGGCQTPRASAPPAPLQLVASSPLILPASCEAVGSYFVTFTVYEDGRTGAIKTPAGTPCVAEALSAWIASFRYAPQARPVDTGVEWMLVSARRGS
jgi:hypothetical protein